MHNIQYSTYPENVDRKAVEAELDNFVRAETYQEGGHGLDHPIRWLTADILASESAAQDYLKKHYNGWYDQLAVRFYDNDALPQTAKEADLRKRAGAARQKYAKLKTDFCFAGVKAAYKSCPNCGSKLSVEYLRKRTSNVNACPLCGADLRTESAIAAEQTAYAKWQKLLSDAEAEHAKKRPGAPVKWLVKIEYHT